MRYMVIVKEDPEQKGPPTSEMIAEMGKYNDKLIDAGVMLAGDGLLPSSKGMRVKFAKGAAPKVIDGPFAEAKELIGGFWIMRADSREEILGWVRQIPFSNGEEVEVRRIAEPEDYVSDEISGETLRKEREWHDANDPKPIRRP